MLYYVRRFPDEGTEVQQGEALARLVANAGSLTIHAVRVGSNAGLYIDVPEAVTSLVELRVLPALVGMEGCLERRKAFIQRPEWALHALLTPTTDAEPLDISVLDRSTSACLTLNWAKAGVTGHLWASADDVPLLDVIEQRGWNARVVPSGITGRLAVLVHRPRKTTLQPILSLRPPATQAPPTTVVVPMISEANNPAEAAPAEPTSDKTPLPAFVAGPGASGLVLGMDATAMPLALAFRPQRMAVDAGNEALAEVVALLLERAFELQAGVVAIIPHTVAQELKRSPWRERLRWLDGSDPYQSASLPWRSLPPDTLDAALLAGGILPSGSGGRASSFANLLEQAGAAAYATDTVRSLTAPPGDDLRGVVAAGGGVVLVDDADVSAPLLAALLLQVLAMLPPVARPIVLFRPDRVSLPDALTSQVIDIVLGTSTATHSTLTQTDDGWMLRSADGAWQQALVADLRNLAAAPDTNAHQTLMYGLEGSDELTAPVHPRTPAEIPVVEALQDENVSFDEEQAAVTADRSASAFAWDTVNDQVDASLSSDASQTSGVGVGNDVAEDLQRDQAFTDDTAEEVSTEQPTSEMLEGVADEPASDGILPDELLADEALAEEPAREDLLHLAALKGIADEPFPDELHDEEWGADEALDLAALEAIGDEPLEQSQLAVVVDEPVPDELLTEEWMTDEVSGLPMLERLANGLSTEELVSDEVQADSWTVEPLDEVPVDMQGMPAQSTPDLAPMEEWNVSLGNNVLLTPQRATTWRRHPRLRRWEQRSQRAQPTSVAQADMSATLEVPQRIDETHETLRVQRPADGSLSSVDSLERVAPPDMDTVHLLNTEDEEQLTQRDEAASREALEASYTATNAPLNDATRDTMPVAVALDNPPADPVVAQLKHLAPEVAQAVRSVPAATPSQATPTSALDLSAVAEQLQAALEQGFGLPALVAQVAPHYPHVAPATLRTAIRQFIATNTALATPLVVPVTPQTPAPVSMRLSGDTPAPQPGTPLDMSAIETATTAPLEADTNEEQTAAPLEVDSLDTEEALTLDEHGIDDALPIEQELAPLEGTLPVTEGESSASLESVRSVSTVEAAAELGVTPKTIQRWENDGKICTFRDRRNRRRIPQSEVARLRSAAPSR